MRPYILLLLACGLLCGCAPTTVSSLVQQQGAQKLSPVEVLALVNGNTLLIEAFGENSSLYFDPSGQLFGKALSADTDKGKWDVSEGGEVCFHMNKWWYGDLRCFQVYRSANGDKVHLAGSGGVLRYAAQPQAGDSRQLAAADDPQQKSLRRSLRTAVAVAPVPKRVATEPKPTATKPTVIEDARPRIEADRDTSATIEWMAKDCPGCNLAGADLGKAELIAAHLAKADLHGANLSMANLRRADLQGANLREAILTYANLPGADLRGADLRGAKLKGANLIRADLTGAKLEGADLTEVLREGTRGLK